MGLRKDNIGGALQTTQVEGTAPAASVALIAAPTKGRIVIHSFFYSNDSLSNFNLKDSSATAVFPTVYLGARGGIAVDNVTFFLTRLKGLNYNVTGTGNYSLIVEWQLDGEM